jgi:hypothetical protein
MKQRGAVGEPLHRFREDSKEQTGMVSGSSGLKSGLNSKVEVHKAIISVLHAAAATRLKHLLFLVSSSMNETRV